MQQYRLLSALLAFSLFVAPVASAAPINENTDPANGPVLMAGPFSWARNRSVDAKIRTSVKMAIWNDPVLDNAKINIDVRNGNVTLNGAVPTQAQADRAAQIARSAADVKGVTNKLVVIGTQTEPYTLTDKAVEKVDNVQTSARIRANILKEGLSEGAEIKVRTVNDIVILEGHVSSWDQYNRASQVAWRTPGIQKVINRLKVR